MKKLIIACACALLAGGCSFDAPTNAPSPTNPVDALIETALAAHEAATGKTRPARVILREWGMGEIPPEVADEVRWRSKNRRAADAADDVADDVWALFFTTYRPDAVYVGVRDAAEALVLPLYGITVTRGANGLHVGEVFETAQRTVTIR